MEKLSCPQSQGWGNRQVGSEARSLPTPRSSSSSSRQRKSHLESICLHLKQEQYWQGWEPRHFSVQPCGIPSPPGPSFRISAFIRAHHKMPGHCPFSPPKSLVRVSQLDSQSTHQAWETGDGNCQAPSSYAAVINISVNTLLQPHICPLPICVSNPAHVTYPHTCTRVSQSTI